MDTELADTTKNLNKHTIHKALCSQLMLKLLRYKAVLRYRVVHLYPPSPPCSVTTKMRVSDVELSGTAARPKSLVPHRVPKPVGPFRTFRVSLCSMHSFRVSECYFLVCPSPGSNRIGAFRVSMITVSPTRKPPLPPHQQT